MTEPCPSCESPDTWEEEVTEVVPYGPVRGINISATYPRLHCRACGDTWTDERGERARDAAVGFFLVNLTDREVERLQRAFAVDWNSRESVGNAIRGLQSTDHPSLVGLHDELQRRWRELGGDES